MRRKMAVVLLILAALVSAFFSSGCWDSREIEELAQITLVSFDIVTENNEEVWQASLRILNPKSKRSSEGQATQGASLESLIKATGITIQDAYREALRRVPKIAYYGHIEAIIIGERAAKERTGEIVELLMRHLQVRLTTQVLVSKGDAFEILNAETGLTSTLSKKIRSGAEKIALIAGVSHGVSLSEFTGWLLCDDRDAVLTLVKQFYPTKGEKTTEKGTVIEGLGVFKGPTLVGFLDTEETIGSILITQKYNNGQMRIPISKEDHLFSYVLAKSRSKIEVKLIDEVPVYTLKIKAYGSVIETGQFNIEFATLKHYEKDISEEIRKIVLKTIDKAKVFNSDFLGFNQELHRVYPKAWETIRENWRESFVQAQIEVEVDAKILNTGEIGKKLQFKE